MIAGMMPDLGPQWLAVGSGAADALNAGHGVINLKGGHVSSKTTASFVFYYMHDEGGCLIYNNCRKRDWKFAFRKAAADMVVELKFPDNPPLPYVFDKFPTLQLWPDCIYIEIYNDGCDILEAVLSGSPSATFASVVKEIKKAFVDQGKMTNQTSLIVRCNGSLRAKGCLKLATLYKHSKDLLGIVTSAPAKRPRITRRTPRAPVQEVLAQSADGEESD